jgi:hypothetical protein
MTGPAAYEGLKAQKSSAQRASYAKFDFRLTDVRGKIANGILAASLAQDTYDKCINI